MDGQLKAGTFLTSESSNKYKVNTLLGAGGQGEVYDVECGGKHYALKWYFKHMATKSQKEILDNLITRGAPDDSFLWPQDLIFKGYGESFGYIMPLRPKNFKSIVDMMKRRAEPSFRTLCKAAYIRRLETACLLKWFVFGTKRHTGSLWTSRSGSSTERTGISGSSEPVFPVYRPWGRTQRKEARTRADVMGAGL